MLKPIRSKAVSVMNHVNTHRGLYVGVTVFTIMVALQYRASQQWSEFLVEKGIDPMEFFIPEYYEELKNL
jgi:hypothetical protein